jgi:hypothetical protein
MNAPSASTPAPQSTALTIPSWAEVALRPFIDRGDYELLLPALPVSGDLGQGLAPAVSVVRIDPNPLGGEVFKVGSRKKGEGYEDIYSYAKPGLEKLAAAAGIQIRTRRVDDRKDRDYVEFEAIGGMRNESGEIVMRAGTAGVRFSEYAEDRWTEIMAANEKSTKYKKQEPELRSGWQAEMAQYRKHIVSRVETKAALRVIRSLLAIKSQLTAEQVARPKVLLRVNLDMRDAEVRGALLTRGLSAGALLYGPQSRSGAEVMEPEEATPRPALAARDDEGDEPLGAVEQEPAATVLASDAEHYFRDGCGKLGLDMIQSAELLARAGMDYAKAGAELDKLAASGQ